MIKFKSLLCSGRNASLTVKAEAGKASISLHVDLGDVLPLPIPHQYHHQGSRNGPARKRRRERRAAARVAAQSTEELIEENDEAVEETAPGLTNNVTEKDFKTNDETGDAIA